MLTDTTPLAALIDTREPSHARCAAIAASFRDTLETTWPCITEASYLLHRSGGWPRVEVLLQMLSRGILRVHYADQNELDRIITLMTKYRDLPCHLADASLVAAAETLRTGHIFTLDSHFYAYRKADGSAFIVVP